MGRGGIPDRWLPYTPMGSVVPGTRFIACKVPLKDALLRKVPEKERFGPKHLMDAFPTIGLLIDLTNTMRYYTKEDFTLNNVKYEKIFCPGHVIPPNSIVKKFFDVVDQFLKETSECQTFIMVHCTHGVNRTGYFICRYMIETLKIPPEEALKRFQQARGHKIERQPYIDDLMNGCKGGSESDLQPRFSHQSSSKEKKIKRKERKIERRDRKIERRDRNNEPHRRRRSVDKSQSDRSNFYNRRADNYPFNYRPSKWPNSESETINVSERKYYRHESIMEDPNLFMNIPYHRLWQPKYQLIFNGSNNGNYQVNQDSLPYQQNNEKLNGIHQYQPVNIDEDSMNSQKDLLRAKTLDCAQFPDQSHEPFVPAPANSLIQSADTKPLESEPTDKPSPSGPHCRNVHHRDQVFDRDSVYRPYVYQNCQLKNASLTFRSQRPPQNVIHSYGPPNLQPHYPRTPPPGVLCSMSSYRGGFSNSSVRPRQQFSNRVWQRPQEPTTNLPQQSENLQVR